MSERKKLAKRLVAYARARLGLGPLDGIYAENIILALLKEDAPYEGSIEEEIPELPDGYYQELEKALEETGCEDPHKAAVAVFGLLSPRPDALDERFRLLMKKDPFLATEDLLEVGRHSGYYAESALRKNIRWDAVYPDGGSPLVMTINLAKPEKSNKDIAAALKAKGANYPACALCKENLGYEGSGKIPPRGTLRFVSITLDGEPWYLQYSPYGYYSRHCIVFHDQHRPMKIDGHCFRALLDFVDLFPRFFIGSNSDLPIVGGSILTHEHFQGGDKELPLFKAKKRQVVATKDGVEVSILDFYDSVLLLEGKDKGAIVELATSLLAAWRKEVDPDRHFVGRDADGTEHQTFTPFASKEGDLYRFYLIFRCNAVSPEHPGGIFHAHEDKWAIKKEGIGLIEAAGLFVLPARLKRQLALLAKGAEKKVPFADLVKENPDLQEFSSCYEHLRSGESVESYVNGICRSILDDVAVYKKDDQASFARFVEEHL